MSDFEDKLKEINNTKDTTAEFDAKDIEDNKFMAILAYISWLVLIPLFAAKESKYARFHANQGIILAIAEIAVWVVFGVLTQIPVIGFIFNIIDVIISILFFAYAVLGIINVINGKAKELPFIGKYTVIK